MYRSTLLLFAVLTIVSCNKPGEENPEPQDRLAGREMSSGRLRLTGRVVSYRIGVVHDKLGDGRFASFDACTFAIEGELPGIPKQFTVYRRQVKGDRHAYLEQIGTRFRFAITEERLLNQEYGRMIGAGALEEVEVFDDRPEG